MHNFKLHTAATARRLPAALLLLFLLGAPPVARAGEATRARQPACGIGPSDPAARDPATLIRALYAIVSGPANAAKDWARLQRLHAPGALITPTQHAPAGFAAAPQSLAQFIELNERIFAARGFYERGISQRLERFGHIAHVWSSYETREQPGGPVQARGLNSFQLLNDGQRWCVLSATWETDIAEHPLHHAHGALKLAPEPGYTGKLDISME